MRVGRTTAFWAISAAIGLCAYALLASPLCPEAADAIGGWHPLAVLPMVLAAMIAARLLRRLVLGRGRASLVAAAVLHPIVSSLVFAFLFGFCERSIQGRLGVGAALREAALGTPYGALYCLRWAWVTMPLGLVGIAVLRAAMRHGARGPGE